MVLFLLCALVTIMVVLLLLRPFLHNVSNFAQKEEYSLKIYKDQLTELDKDFERGLILPEERDAARTEIERRMVQEASASEKSTATISALPIYTIIALVSLLPLGAGIVYFTQGSPTAKAMPFAKRTDATQGVAAADGMHSGMNDRITTLQKRLLENPEDMEGWGLLARSLVNLNRHAEAVTAYQEAIRLQGGTDRQLSAEYAEALVIANDGLVGPESLQIFRIFLEEDANDPQATYYIGLYKAQNGDETGALNDWNRLLANSPADAPWVGIVRQQINNVTGQQDGSTSMTSSNSSPNSNSPGNPTRADIEAAQQLSSEDREQMIQGMVASLESKMEDDPDNLAGWQRLARSYTFLGRNEDAKRAYNEILRLSPNDQNAKAALAALGN